MIDPSFLKQTFKHHQTIAVAVSGGGDSMALLVALAKHLDRNLHDLVVLSVDHGLRAEARREIEFVERFCQTLDLPHETLVWGDVKPERGLSEAARLARYELLGEACLRHKASALALGHIAEDCAETVLMRIKRVNPDSDTRGLAGICHETLMKVGPTYELSMLRPFLRYRRQDLRRYLLDNRGSWLEDPTNQNWDFERVRARSFLQNKERLIAHLIAFSALVGRERSHLAGEVAEFLKSSVEVTDSFGVLVDRHPLNRLSPYVAVLSFQSLLSVVGGVDHLPSRKKAQMALASIQSGKSVSLGRCVVLSRKNEIIIEREVRNLPEELMLRDNWLLWDNRFWIRHECATTESVRLVPGSDNSLLSIKEEVEEKIAKTMPYFVCYDSVCTSVRPAISATAGREKNGFRYRLGAFDTFSPHWDRPIRKALGELFHPSVHDKNDQPVT